MSEKPPYRPWSNEVSACSEPFTLDQAPSGAAIQAKDAGSSGT